GFHQLIATLEFFIHPARNIDQPFGSQAPAVAKPAIHGYRIIVLEVFDDHVELVCHPRIIRAATPGLRRTGRIKGWLYQTLRGVRLACSITGPSPTAVCGLLLNPLMVCRPPTSRAMFSGSA